MANWYGAARSNYVKIKDMDGLKAALEPFPIKLYITLSGEDEGKVCFMSDEQDSGGWPSFGYLEDAEDEEIEFDPAVQICPFMEDDQILVMMVTGAEKLRYLTGHADAYNSKGEWCAVNINDIYKKAAEQFGVDVASITACEY